MNRTEDDGPGLFATEDIMKLPQFSKPMLPLGNNNEKEGLLLKKVIMPGQNLAHSLKAEAKKKLNLMKNTVSWGKQTEGFLKERFKDSLILQNDEGERLYLNLPFSLDNNLPEENIIYYRSEQSGDGPDMASLFKNHEHPNIILMQKGSLKFGGYASHPWIHQTKKLKIIFDIF